MTLEQVKKLNIPQNPGCYQYFDADGKLLYIGKAANLYKRVLSYWRKNANHSPAKRSMMPQIARINIIEVGSEIEALLLESNLIKKHQPPYNIIMRDDKRYQYIKITADEYPRVITTREIGKTGRYFGPFTSGTAVVETMKAIRKIFPFGGFATMPANKMNETKVRRYPELYGAPTDRKEYLKVIAQIKSFLEGNARQIFKELELKIKKEELKNSNLNKKSEEFKISQEKVSWLKYRILNMKNVLAHANVLSLYDKYAADVVELAKVLSLIKVPQRIEGYDISNLFGQNAVGSMVVFKNGEPDKNEYRKFTIKGDTALPTQPASLRPGTSLDRGEYFAKELSPEQDAFQGVKDRYSLLKTPSNSPSKKGRKNDDTAMLKEILERRFKHGSAQGEQSWPLPDLIVIDGGKGQLNAGLAILKKTKLDIPVIAISKGEGRRSAKAPDKIFFPGEKTPLKLPLASPALHIIKRVRDEAHRFAIAYHRQKRNKKTFTSL